MTLIHKLGDVDVDELLAVEEAKGRRPLVSTAQKLESILGEPAGEASKVQLDEDLGGVGMWQRSLSSHWPCFLFAHTDISKLSL